jgi:Icc protein
MKVFPLPTYSLSPNDPNRAVLLQITDPHLFADSQGALLGVTTYRSFKAVLSAIESQNRPFDAILATGDISQDHSLDSYRGFAKEICRWSQPCFWLPGNHDEQDCMKQLTPIHTIHPHKVVLIGDNWLVVLLNSQVKGVPYGQVTKDELNFLCHALQVNENRHVLVALHHNPIPIGSHWLDQHALQNQSSFWAVLSEYSQVKGVLCGHVHQAMDKYCHGIKVMSSPSTCIQFKPNSDDFSLDDQNPGWRYVNLLDNGQIETEICRLSGVTFRPKLDAKGY